MNKKTSLVVILSLFFVSGTCYWYFSHRTVKSAPVLETAIVPYNEAKHKEFIHQEFKKNWYLLISSPDYSIDYMLDTASPNNYEPQYKGKMKIVVLEVAGEPAGFGTYYMRTRIQGDILFIEVADKFRGKRHAATLVNFAEQELKKMGAKVCKLATRSENKSARRVYTRLNYPETSERRGFVHYRKEL